ncbi:MAG: tetrathionate reductase family octaheme c-type cytochrome [Bacteroidales bacterium]|nr:tetrathionate reductase family octaheme c-type cytochrome [Bacteroidales bacterium]
MKKFIEIVSIIIVPWIIIFWIVFTFNGDRDSQYFSKDHIVVQHKKAAVDHSKFPALQKMFKTPQEMTAACLSCHNKTGQEFMKTPHWQWKQLDTIPGRGVHDLGKINLLNNFCIGVNSNEFMCSMCHAGYGYDRKGFDFHAQDNIDCVVCHDNTGTYQKSNPGKGKMLPGAGYPAPGTDLNKVAQHVGNPQKSNCGSCHFVGGGGNNVKHGDLEKAQLSCTRDLDVHMASKGKDAPNLDCQDCHKTEHHNITGHLYTVASSASNRSTCVQCHTDKPHESKLLNDHFKTIACQTCHIPVYAKGAATKIIWDWSSALRMDKNGKPIPGETLPGNTYTFDGKTFCNVTIHYDSKHGTAVFQKNVEPEYVWFNGTANHHLLHDKIGDTASPLTLNPLFGSYQDRVSPANPENPSKIWPVKVMRGKQPYDPVNRLLINPKLFSREKGKGALWVDFDWNVSAKAGMEYVGLPYSGQLAFMKTQSMWLLNHEVAPADQALQCTACHTNTNSKLKNLSGFYLPGRDNSNLLDNAGLVFIILVLIGVSVHGILRIVSRKH